MYNYEVINDMLVRIFNDLLRLEEKAVITDEYKDISNNDLHNIEAIGLGKGSTMSAIAEKRHVTAGTLTTAMNSLVKKGYVTRERSEEDRRVVYIRLTEKGEKAYRHHADFHARMVRAAVDSLQAEEVPPLLQTLEKVLEFFEHYQ